MNTDKVKSRTPLIAGNWKMNLDHLQAIGHIQKLAWLLEDAKYDYSLGEIVVIPSYTSLRSAQTLIEAEKLPVLIGAQDVSGEESGAFTGEVSASMLSRLSVTYVLVGHSERRSLHQEGVEMIRAKLTALWSHALTPILCVGETLSERELEGNSAVPIRQLVEALTGLEVGPLVIAYEPVWAIGTGQVATPEQAQEVALAIRLALNELAPDLGRETRILYGGSVKSSNIAGFMRESDIDGALVGGASLDPDEFAAIAQYRKHLVL